MKIIIDAMGGDFAPFEVVKGCTDAARDFNADFVLVGDENKITAELKKYDYPKNKISIVHAGEVITGENNTMSAIREKKDSSMVKGLNMLSAGEGDAFVSAGNTGALIAGSTLVLKRIKGVRRVALAPIMPAETGFFLLVDAGANVECSAAFLIQFAVMGSIYMQKVMGISEPRVGLVNIGAEEGKGRDEIAQANKMLHEVNINYIGNIEGRDIPQGEADVIVCDGFTGNVLLKFMEGMGIVFNRMLKDLFFANTLSKMSALFVKKGLKTFKKKMDYTEYGGAVLLGTTGPVIKAHGSSNAKAFYHAIRQASLAVSNNVVGEISENIEKYEVLKNE